MEDIEKILHENQNLMEIIEVAKQITSDLDIKRITKNINFFVKSRFDAKYCSFILPAEIDDDRPLEFFYQNGILRKNLLPFDSLTPLIDYFSMQEYNQISYAQFSQDFPRKEILDVIDVNCPEFVVPLRSDKGITGVYLQGAKSDGTGYSTAEIQFMVNLTSFASIAIENANLYRRATVDRMTKLYNHHQFQKTLEEYIDKYAGREGTFSLLIFDIDHFKLFNDNYGHLQGDSIIKELAHIMLTSVRELDYPARYGGEEFAVILPDTPLDGAYEFAERLRKTIANHEFAGEEHSFQVTVSTGVAEFNELHVKCNEDMISAADKALYWSKENGRNRVKRYTW